MEPSLVAATTNLAPFKKARAVVYPTAAEHTQLKVLVDHALMPSLEAVAISIPSSATATARTSLLCPWSSIEEVLEVV